MMRRKIFLLLILVIPFFNIDLVGQTADSTGVWLEIENGIFIHGVKNKIIVHGLVDSTRVRMFGVGIVPSHGATIYEYYIKPVDIKGDYCRIDMFRSDTKFIKTFKIRVDKSPQKNISSDSLKGK